MPEPNATFCIFIHTTGFDQFGDTAQSVLGVADDSIYHEALAGTQLAGFEATEAMCFVDHEIDMAGGGEEVGGLLADSFELICYFEDLDCNIDARADGGEGIQRSKHHGKSIARSTARDGGLNLLERTKFNMEMNRSSVSVLRDC